LASFFISSPNPQSLTVDRNSNVNSNSEVNVYDPDATDGYAIKAKLTADVSLDFAVYIWSDDSTICTETDKCLLSTTDRIIYANFTDSATIGGGDTINFDLNIISGNNVAIDTHDVYVEYTKQRASFMQQFSTAKCNGMLEYPLASSELDLMDVRDGKIYKIRKLADHNCWMVDNLALDGSQTIDSTTSDIADTYTLPAIITPNEQTYCADLDTTIYANKCGNHYTWTTAGAGVSGNVTATTSICPKNWKLPTNTEYTTLSTDLAWGGLATNVISSAWRGLYSGAGNTTNTTSLYGYYWTATGQANNNSYYLLVDGNVGSVSVTYASRASLYSVRCLAR
jgi:uncharacterized protein (TIGR02145 family)